MEDAAKTCFLVVGPYLWIGNGNFGGRLLNAIILVMIGYFSHVIVYYLDKYEERIVNNSKRALNDNDMQFAGHFGSSTFRFI